MKTENLIEKMKEDKTPTGYIIGPYRSSNISIIKKNIQKAERLAMFLWKESICYPLCPHKNTEFFDGLCEDDKFLIGDLKLLSCIDTAFVICPGSKNSKGSLQEIEFCEREGKPIFYCIEERLNDWVLFSNKVKAFNYTS